jgi:glycyl-tRNA synthetase beta chain
VSEFLLEIGVEEVPAWMIKPALADLRRALREKLAEVRMDAGEIRTYATPRRLVALAPELPERQPDIEELVTGPPHKAAPQAAESFARKLGVTVHDLQIVATPKGEYYGYRRKEKGRPTAELLPGLLPEVILGIHWPKTMYWAGKNGARFIRPIRSLLALYDGQVIPLEIAGVRAANRTFGRRGLGKSALSVENFADFGVKLRANGVILDPAERRRKILEETAALLPAGCRLRSNPALLDTLVYLTEFPTPALGAFDPGYLALPEEVLVTVMEHHQKYLAVETAGGQLSPHFIFVMNRGADTDGTVRHGNERVLRARFNDARFFWETDQKIPLRDRGPMLKHVTFQAKLGSYAEKTKRVVAAARTLAPEFGADIEATARAAELAKCDLTTELVKEFTELQGVVGGLYARAQGEPEKVAAAIYDHYKPESMEDASPRTPEGAALSAADKMDTLQSFWSLGIVPKGSKDPFALRRAAQGIIKIFADHRCTTPLASFASAGPGLGEFMRDRLEYYLREIRGFAYDEVNAVLAVRWSEVPDALDRCAAIAKVRPTANFEPLSMAFKRIRNILTKAGGAEKFSGDPDPALLEEGPERDLYQEARRTQAETEGQDYETVLRLTAGLRPAVDSFFDTVLVMADESRRRQNRLTLLAWLSRAFTRVADFSEIVTSREKDQQA